MITGDLSHLQLFGLHGPLCVPGGLQGVAEHRSRSGSVERI